jgi:cellulose synthase/poly-beta-1,6-N-acetylglucosamine synthase-like glycosyltransferase
MKNTNNQQLRGLALKLHNENKMWNQSKTKQPKQNDTFLSVILVIIGLSVFTLSFLLLKFICGNIIAPIVFIGVASFFLFMILSPNKK